MSIEIKLSIKREFLLIGGSFRESERRLSLSFGVVN